MLSLRMCSALCYFLGVIQLLWFQKTEIEEVSIRERIYSPCAAHLISILKMIEFDNFLADNEGIEFSINSLWKIDLEYWRSLNVAKQIVN